jgi:hypothetical protein
VEIYLKSTKHKKAVFNEITSRQTDRRGGLILQKVYLAKGGSKVRDFQFDSLLSWFMFRWAYSTSLNKYNVTQTSSLLSLYRVSLVASKRWVFKHPRFCTRNCISKHP